MFKFNGIVSFVGEKQQVSEKFAKREIVLTDNAEKYPQEIAFQFTQDKCDLLNGIGVGQEVEISFSLKGRKWTSPQGENKWFNTLDAFKIEQLGGAPASVQAPASVATEEDDALPF